MTAHFSTFLRDVHDLPFTEDAKMNNRWACVGWDTPQRTAVFELEVTPETDLDDWTFRGGASDLYRPAQIGNPACGTIVRAIESMPRYTSAERTSYPTW